jgi:hypothetical protein
MGHRLLYPPKRSSLITADSRCAYRQWSTSPETDAPEITHRRQPACGGNSDRMKISDKRPVLPNLVVESADKITVDAV